MKIQIIGNNAFAHSLKMAFTVLNYDVKMGQDCFDLHFIDYNIICDGKLYNKINISNAIVINPFHKIFYKEKALENDANTIINCSLESYDLMKQERPEAGIDKIKGMKLFVTKELATDEQIELVKKVFAGTGIDIKFKETIEEVNTVFYKQQLEALKSGKITMKDLQPYLEVDEKSFVNALKI